MKSVMSVLVLVGFISGCVYDPANYEKLRIQENLQQSKMMG